SFTQKHHVPFLQNFGSITLTHTRGLGLSVGSAGVWLKIDPAGQLSCACAWMNGRAAAKTAANAQRVMFLRCMDMILRPVILRMIPICG
ncbi:MAG TPA: hypothetical protein PKN23_12940, partial [Candidatus Hydrogenedentes bacterium]|nr:hypothetical protein [Candidatus Hydrogenedentota bacterium]